METIDERGLVENGKPNPYLKLYNRLQKNFTGLCKEFGMSPKSRTSLKIFQHSEISL